MIWIFWDFLRFLYIGRELVFSLVGFCVLWLLLFECYCVVWMLFWFLFNVVWWWLLGCWGCCLLCVCRRCCGFDIFGGIVWMIWVWSIFDLWYSELLECCSWGGWFWGRVMWIWVLLFWWCSYGWGKGFWRFWGCFGWVWLWSRFLDVRFECMFVV